MDARVDGLMQRICELEMMVLLLKNGGCACSESEWYLANLVGFWRCSRCGAVRSPGFGDPTNKVEDGGATSISKSS